MYRAIRIIALAGMLAALASCQENSATHPSAISPVIVNFEGDPPGKAPAGFTVALTGGGGAAQWAIENDATAGGQRVLAQISSEPVNDRFPQCIYDGLTAKDVVVTVSFKTISGKIDQGAGIIVRWQDADNYYVMRANALEDNVRLYRVVKGKRTRIAGVDVKAPASGQWQALGLSVQGTRFSVMLNGKHLFDATDGTFTEAGKVGLWTKADSVTRFDNFVIAPW